MIFVGLKRYFISTISNHSLSVQLRVLTAETMEISASLNKLVVVKGQAGSTTEAVLFRSIFCKIRWEQQEETRRKVLGRVLLGGRHNIYYFCSVCFVDLLLKLFGT